MSNVPAFVVDENDYANFDDVRVKIDHIYYENAETFGVLLAVEARLALKERVHRMSVYHIGSDSLRILFVASPVDRPEADFEVKIMECRSDIIGLPIKATIPKIPETHMLPLIFLSQRSGSASYDYLFFNEKRSALTKLGLLIQTTAKEYVYDQAAKALILSKSLKT